MTTKNSELTDAVAVYLASRLARPEFAYAAWIGAVKCAPSPAPPASLPIRRMFRLGTTELTDYIDLLVDLEALPFRDQQFQGVVIDTLQVNLTQIKQVEQLYRVLAEHAVLILVGRASSNWANSKSLLSLFRPKRILSQSVFLKRYRQWPMQQRPGILQNLTDSVRSLTAYFPGTAQIILFDKITPPPPMAGLLHPVAKHVTAAMPTQSLASTTNSPLVSMVSTRPKA